MKQLMLLIVAIACVACERVGPLDANDPRAIYLEQNLPHLKLVRDQIAFEYVTCKHNIEKLLLLCSSFHHEEAKEHIRAKVESLKLQRNQLKFQLDRIDTEVEHGIARREINQIDGGGLRQQELNKLMAQSAKCLKTAKDANSAVVRIYDNTEVAPPKVVPVRRN